MSRGTVARQLDGLIPPDRNIQISDLKAIQQKGWSGGVSSPECRAMYWRICLGVVSNSQSSQWKLDLFEQVSDYRALQGAILPDISAVEVDPLSHMLSPEAAPSAESQRGKGWDKYFEHKESLKLIIADLDRLYLTGVEDEFFQSPERRKMLENILFIWSARHESVSYRQGMHEIAGTVLLVVLQELAGWDAEGSQEEEAELGAHPLRSCFTLANVEAYTFWIFERIMKDLSPLYDPAVGADHQPAVVQFCTNIQENLLRHNDPELCDFLESQFIQAQLYGMRWARLLLGREFTVTERQVLRIWDYLFASCVVFPQPVVDLMDPLSAELLASSTHAEVVASRARYGPSNPLLIMLGNFMLAMLLYVRGEMLSGDVSTALALLMRYPAMEDISPIVDYADMIRRGVLDPGAHAGRILGGGLLSSEGPPLAADSADPGRRELRVRLKEVATPMLSMGRRVSQMVSGSTAAAGPSADPLLGADPLSGPPQENLSKTHGLFSSLTKGGRVQRQGSGGVDALMGEAAPPARKKSLFQTEAKKANSATVIADLEKRIGFLTETQRFVGDSILDIIGDLERTVISGIDGDGAREGNVSIVRLKELVRVLCGELSIEDYSSNCCSGPAEEDIPRRRTGSTMADGAGQSPKQAQGHADPLAALDTGGASWEGALPPAVSGDQPPPRQQQGQQQEQQQPDTPQGRRRQSSVSELLGQPDSDDDASASPRAQLKKSPPPN